jgi:propanol-preferring alcohol dehydrogenase
VQAVRYRTVGSAPEVVGVPMPAPGPGQVLLKVTAAGLCHSDLAFMSRPEARFPYPLPLTLGHEAAGTVAALGSGATGVAEGDEVAVYGPWGCGLCRMCVAGRGNCCPPRSRARHHAAPDSALRAPWRSTWWWTRRAIWCR